MGTIQCLVLLRYAWHFIELVVLFECDDHLTPACKARHIHVKMRIILLQLRRNIVLKLYFH
jgi:hypothetical protein